MNNQVLKTISDHGLLVSDDNVIVALSGGADSVSLLHVLLSLRDELRINVMAAHVNHQLRGAESLRDEEFVRLLCSALSVELFVRTADVNKLSAETGESVELCGRKVRYEFFSELAKAQGAKIATAHTLSDSEETMLYNMARGTTLHGLCSIPYKRDYIIRPLLDVTREQVECYCESNSLEFVQDSTNFDEEVCKRNKIRLSVLPPLRELNSGFHNNFSRLREQLSAVDEYMHTTAAEALESCRCDYGLSAEKLSSLPEGLLGYVLTRYLAESGATAEYRHISICKSILRSGGAVCLPQGFTALCRQGVFRLKHCSSAESFSELSVEVPMNVFYEEKEYSFIELNTEEIIYKKLSSDCLDYDIISSGAKLRTRREGDTFSHPKRGVTKPLRKLQNELKIPAEKRDESLVIALDNTILWAEDIGVSKQGMIKKDSKKAIYIEVKRGKNNA
ncbi:MAG: tRNA lysidine(34) synthetase TilS [Clostridia bacterium]|nr:tRNA lysidine(34) synthetase TilS [Clostridia bacterium]